MAWLCRCLHEGGGSGHEVETCPPQDCSFADGVPSIASVPADKRGCALDAEAAAAVSGAEQRGAGSLVPLDSVFGKAELDQTSNAEEQQLEATPRSSSAVQVDEQPVEIHQIYSAFTRFSDVRLKRGMPATGVLANFGGLLENSAGSALTFEMSRPVEKLHSFISHNWAVGRFPKFMALAYHFNFVLAIIACTLGSFTLGILIYLGCIPTAAWGKPIWVCTPSSILLFVGSLLFGHELRRLLGFHGQYVFLDKACIHQVDEVIQRKGIESLGAYLRVSDEMIIVYTELYLTKLWTVYELASMLSIKAVPQIKVIPTALVATFFLSMFAWCVMMLAFGMGWAVEARFINIAGLSTALVDLSVLPMFLTLRKWMRAHANVKNHVSSFNIRSAKCFVESDRELVHKNVSILMREQGFVGRDAPEGEALDVFDNLVRDFVPNHLTASFGRLGTTWCQSLGAYPVIIGFAMDVVCSNEQGGRRGKEFDYFVWMVAGWSLVLFAFYPLWMACSAWLAGRFLHLQGIWACLYVVAVWQGLFVLMLSGLLATWVLTEGAAAYNPVMVAGFAAYFLLVSVLAVLVFRPIRIPPCRAGKRRSELAVAAEKAFAKEVAAKEKASAAERADASNPAA